MHNEYDQDGEYTRDDWFFDEEPLSWRACILVWIALIAIICAGGVSLYALTRWLVEAIGA